MLTEIASIKITIIFLNKDLYFFDISTISFDVSFLLTNKNLI